MLDFQAGQPLRVTVSTDKGESIILGQFSGSDESDYILRSEPHTSRERLVCINRDKITAIEKIPLLAMPKGSPSLI